MPDGLRPKQESGSLVEARIEADEAMRDYDALELDAGIMLEALEKIAQRTGIVTHTASGVVLRSAPEWTGEGANRIAREALEALSEYAAGMRRSG